MNSPELTHPPQCGSHLRAMPGNVISHGTYRGVHQLWCCSGKTNHPIFAIIVCLFHLARARIRYRQRIPALPSFTQL
jgi:hypothetical protein